MERAGAHIAVVGLVYLECELPPSLEVEPGGERFVPRIRLGAGGALNAASALDALGVDVTLVYPRGDGLADAAVARALRELPRLRAHPFPSRDDPAISLVVHGPSDHSRHTSEALDAATAAPSLARRKRAAGEPQSGGTSAPDLKGARDRSFVSAADFSALAACPVLGRASFVHVPGLLEAKALFPQLLDARRAGAALSVSGSFAPDGFAWLRSLDGAPLDVLIVNEIEAAALTEGRGGDPLTVLQRASRTVVVTRGERGAAGVFGDERIEVRAEPAPRFVDAVGAGDAFAAGLLAGLLDKRAPRDALLLAARTAARAVAMEGGVVTDPSLLSDLRSAR